MIYDAVYEKYAYKPIRAILLALAIAGDAAAVALFVAAFADSVLFAAAGALIVFDLVMRRVSLELVYSYRYTLKQSGVAIRREVIGRSREVLVLDGSETLTPCAPEHEGKKLFGDSRADLYYVEKNGGKYVVSLDAYMFAMLKKEVSNDISG